MIRLRNAVPLATAFVAATALLAPMSARADFQLRITDGSGTYFGAASSPLTASPGITIIDADTISFVIRDSSYAIIGSLTFNNNPGTPGLAVLDINYEVSTIPGALPAVFSGGLLTISSTANNYSQPTMNPLTLENTINGNGAGSGTAKAQSYVDPGNVLFGQSVTSGPEPPLGTFDIAAVGGYAGNATTMFNQSGLYSLTDVLTFNLAASSGSSGSTTSGDSQEQVFPTVPSPAGLLLVASGLSLCGFGAFLRRRKRA